MLRFFKYSLFLLHFAHILSPQEVFSDETLIISSPLEKDVSKSVAVKNVLVEAYHNIGYELLIKQYPMERSLVKANTGKVTGELARMEGIDKKYSNLVRVPVPIYYIYISIFTKHIDFEPEGWKNLDKYSIGILRGIKAVEENTRELNIISVSNSISLFRMLDKERVDLVIFIMADGQDIIQNNPEFKNIKILQPYLIKIPLYHYIHKSNGELIEQVKEELMLMEERGRIDEILNIAK